MKFAQEFWGSVVWLWLFCSPQVSLFFYQPCGILDGHQLESTSCLMQGDLAGAIACQPCPLAERQDGLRGRRQSRAVTLEGSWLNQAFSRKQRAMFGELDILRCLDCPPTPRLTALGESFPLGGGRFDKHT